MGGMVGRWPAAPAPTAAQAEQEERRLRDLLLKMKTADREALVKIGATL